MANLIEKYGADWFRNKFNGSYFLFKGMPARVTGITSAVHAKVALRDGAEIKEHSAQVPYDYFPDSSVFNVPDLGYRHSQEGRWLSYISRNNGSYHRGLAESNIRVYESDHTQFLRDSGLPIRRVVGGELNNLVMDPGFIPLYRGIKLMLEGKLMSFAASPTVAVIPDANGEGLIIRMCSKEIGTVTPDGEVSITAPFAPNYVEATVCKQ